MAHIWKSLVSEPKRTIDEHLELIFEDLLLQSGSRLWRSREASCLALADIIQGRKFDQVKRFSHSTKILLTLVPISNIILQSSDYSNSVKIQV